jgi:hypothetical protein
MDKEYIMSLQLNTDAFLEAKEFKSKQDIEYIPLHIMINGKGKDFTIEELKELVK